MKDLDAKIKNLQAEIKQTVDKIGLGRLETELEELRRQINSPDFWQDNLKARQISKREADLAKRVEPWRKLQKSLSELFELADLGDRSIMPELSAQVEEVQTRYDELKKQLRFNGPYDDHDVILSIHAGAGGTDAQDWAAMLMRMYVRWAEGQGVNIKTIGQSPGEEAGLKSVDLELSGGDFLYGKLSGEHGVHRLVRLSPFNADNLRQTSFAKVEVLPLIDQPGEVDVEEADIKIDVFRAGGHGGQSVNTTDSAVRLTHKPTGITVTIQNERSQLQNKETALRVLRSRLAALQLEQHAESLAELKGPSQSAEWGNQIRNYVLHPYKQVKDNRTGFETVEAEKVLDGRLDPIIEAWLDKAKQ